MGEGVWPVIAPVQWAGDSPCFSLRSGPSSHHMLSGDWDTPCPGAVSQLLVTLPGQPMWPSQWAVSSIQADVIDWDRVLGVWLPP